MNYKHALGKWAEDYAALYAERNLGMRIIGRNIKNRYGELDITAIEEHGEYKGESEKFKIKNDDKELVIIEVRCRTENKVQSAVESVGLKKIKALIRAGTAYVNKINWTGFWRIDLIAVTVQREYNGKPFLIEYIPDITYGIV